MNPFQRLAYQVDRKILSTEEADYYRMDIPAHEKLYVGSMVLKQFSYFSELKRFMIAAFLIYLTLFSITNAAAYGKILQANITAWQIENTEVAQLNLLADDPWTGERMAGFAMAADELEALEKSALIPENGILPLNLAPTTYDNRVSIPSIGVNAHIVEPTLGVEALKASNWNVLEDQISSSLLKGIVHYPGTALPGQKGNFFLTGHSSNVFWEVSEYNTVFALLPRIQIGDEIYIDYEQNNYTYKVIETKEVSPKDVSILEQGNRNILTLMTCTPVGTSLRRYVVTAELVQL